jgi:uncharacterized protein (DUF433 family)
MRAWTGPDVILSGGSWQVRWTPTIKGTRIEPDLLLVESEFGRTTEETHDDFPSLPVSTIRAIQAFAANQKQLVP